MFHVIINNLYTDIRQIFMNQNIWYYVEDANLKYVCVKRLRV